MISQIILPRDGEGMQVVLVVVVVVVVVVVDVVVEVGGVVVVLKMLHRYSVIGL